MPLARHAVWALSLLVAGCAGSAPNPELDFVLRQARSGSLDELAALVEHLESDDPAVRLAAIMTLERLTGATHGYRPYDSEHGRDAAVRRWAEAVRAGAPEGSGAAHE
jgi:hypothetical protein